MATTNLTNLKANAFTDVVSTIVNTTSIISTTPKVTSITYPGNDTAANTGGGQTITLTGTGFSSGASILINATYAGVVTVVSNTTITFTSPAQNAGTYTLYVINSDGGTAISIPGISYSGTPTWTTAAGTLGTSYETAAISNSLTATGDPTISYSLYSGTLPPGSSLNSSTGLLSGTSQATASSTTYNFTIRATDGQNQDTDRAFSITISPDVVSWSSPADNSSTSVYEYATITPVTLAASSAAGKSITYTANTLPTGLTISGNTISGTPTVVANTFTQVTANSANTFRTATKNISFIVNPDVVTWSSPADGTSTSLFADTAMSNVTLSAASAAGKSITYSANTLPTGVTITGAVVNGTPTVPGTTNSLITATAATTNRTATRNFTWVVSVANDTYFKYTTLLLNGETTSNSFIADASTNSFGSNINGDTKPVLFNPYQGDGYYSNYFDGTGDYLSLSSAIVPATGNFTIEFWIYSLTNAGSAQRAVYAQYSGGTSGRFMFGLDQSSSSRIWLHYNGTDYVGTTNGILPNTWTHLALVRNGDVFNMYVNGALNATNTFAGASLQQIAGNIGGMGGSFNVNAQVSNLRIVVGTAVYTAAFTPSTTPLTAIANTSLLTCQSNRFIDNSTNNFAITKVGDTTISPNIPFTANASYSTYGSTYFDGTGDYLSIASNSAFAFGTGDFTVEGWYYSTAGNGRFTLYDSGSGGGNGQFSIFQDSASGFYVRMGGDITYASPPGNNQWVHFAVTRSGTTVRLFFNGILAVSGTQSTNITNNTPYIGLLNGYGYPMNGYISDLRVVKGTAVYTTTFTPPTSPLTAIANTSLLTLQYNGGATNQGIIDNSNFNNIITRNGNTSQGTFSPYSVTGWSNYFDGTGDYINAGSGASVNMTGDFTVEMWIYGTNTSWTGGDVIGATCLVDTRDQSNATENNRLALSMNSTGSYPSFYNAGTNVSTASTIPANVGVWNHIAYSRSGSTIKIFVNGVQGASFTDSTAFTAVRWVIGMYASQSGGTNNRGGFIGYISNHRIINGTALYTTAFTPPTSPLTAISGTSLLTCQSNRFIDKSTNNLTLTKAGDVSVQAFGPFGGISEAVPISYSNYFDGTGDYLTVPDNVVLQLGSGDFTVEFWINYNSITGYQSPFTKGYTAAGDILLQTGNGNGALIVYLSGSVVITESTGASIGTWYHYALVRSGTTVTLYRDGVSRGTATSSVNFNTTNQLGIGATGKAPGGGAIGDFTINGYMSNFRVVKGTAVYTTAFTPSTTPLTAIANTSLLTCQSTRMIDNSTNAFTITAAGNVVPRIFNPFGYTAQSATSYTPSLHGGSAYFDGTGDYLNIPYSPSFNFGTGNFTVEGWIYLNSLASSYYVMAGTYTTGTTDEWLIQISNGNTIRFLTSVGTSFYSATITTSTWYHIAAVRNGSTITLYVNGTSVGSYTNSNSIGSVSKVLYIGVQNISTWPMNGYIDDLRITNGTAIYTSNFVPPTTPLTNYSTAYPASLLLNFNNGGIIDQHSTNVLETVSNAQLSTAVKKYGNASMYFDGTGDYLYGSPNQTFNLSVGDFTVELWVYFTGSNNSRGIWAVGNASRSGVCLNISATGRIQSVYGDGVNCTYTDGTTVVQLNTWNHIALSRAGSTNRMYLNGVLENTFTSSNFGAGSYSGYVGDGWGISSGNLVFMSAAASGPILGYIDDFRITKGYARYTSNFTAPTSALITK